MPKKPDRPFATIRFSADGKVSPNVEHTGVEKHVLERRVAGKFVSALKDRGLYDLGEVVADVDEPADVQCFGDGTTCSIQIAEVVDQASRIFQRKKHDLVQRALNDIELNNLFRGCQVSLLIVEEDRELPTPTEQVLDQLRTLGEAVASLETGKMRVRKLASPDGTARVHVVIERFAQNGRAQFIPCGSQALSRTNWLLQTIIAKVEKRYSKPSGDFWLLAYSSEYMFIRAGETAVNETAAYLECNSHPFTKVWYFMPMPNKDAGHVIQVWPYTSD